jgi:hypothetical protein
VRRRTLIAISVVLLAGAVLTWLAVISKRDEKTDEAGSTQAPNRPPDGEAGPEAEERLFAPDSVWNAPLANDAPLDPNNTEIVSYFRKQVDAELQRGNGPWINAGEFSTPVYTVGKDVPPVRVTLDPAETGALDNDLQKAWSRVPLPGGARPARGTDKHLTLWQPSTDRLWEFFGMEKRADGWHARWGGAMRNVSKSPGYFSPASWPGAKAHWGASATSLPVVAGTMRIDELERGEIDHALALGIPKARAGAFSLPAQRTDGINTDPASVPEGARFRLDPKLDIDSLGLDKTTRAMAIAAQRYGIVVRDQSGVISFVAEDPAPTGDNPYPRLFGGKYPSQLLSRFPWNRLQLLKTDIRN